MILNYRMKASLSAAALIIILASRSWAAPGIGLTLAYAENKSLENSQRYKAAVEDAQAALSRADAQRSPLYPKLSLEGTYRYSTSVPEIALPIPGAKPQKLTDNTNYSIGPSVSWTLFEKGASRNSWASAKAAADAKLLDAENVKRQVLLSCRTAYFLSAQAAEQVVLLSDGLNLSIKQYEDIRVNVRAGAKSRIDELSAHQEVLSRQNQFSQARTDLAAAFRDLSALTGDSYGDTLRSPLDARITAPVPEGVPSPTCLISLDPIDGLLERFRPFASAGFSETTPSLAVFKSLAESAQASADGASSGDWPKVMVSAKTSIDYPNGPVFESVNQNSAGLSVNWTLFEAGLTKNRVKESLNNRDAALYRQGQALADMRRDWEKTLDRLSSLAEQENITAVSVSEAQELAMIAYTSYKNGALTYIELQNANYRALEERISLAKIKAQMLLSYAALAYMAQ